MFPFTKKPIDSSYTYTVVVFGGSGTLGKALSKSAPPGTLIVNISRKGEIEGQHVLNVKLDLLSTTPEEILATLVRYVHDVDVLVYAAYSRKFSSVRHLDRSNFLQEMELDVFLPIKIETVCADHFWSEISKEINIRKARKIINISSGASLGKTKRPELATYSGAKAALNVMTEYLHEYCYEQFGTSAHTVIPGSFDSPEELQRTVHAIWQLAKEPHHTYNRIKP